LDREFPGAIQTHITGLLCDYTTAQKIPQPQIVNCDNKSLIAIIKQTLLRTQILQVSCVNTCEANHYNLVILRLGKVRLLFSVHFCENLSAKEIKAVNSCLSINYSNRLIYNNILPKPSEGVDIYSFTVCQ
jgi:hypothetical protein